MLANTHDFSTSLIASKEKGTQNIPFNFKLYSSQGIFQAKTTTNIELTGVTMG